MTAAPVHVVGLWAGRPVGSEAEAAVRSAALVAGGSDQLAAVGDLISSAARTAVVGAGLAALDEVSASAAAVVLASGDPGFHGIMRALAARLGPDRLVVHPAPSSVAAAFARLGRSWDDAVVASCHTGGAFRAAASVAGAPSAAVLCGPTAPPEALGVALVSLGASYREVVVASRLGEVGEAIQRLDGLASLAAGSFDHRSVVVLANPAAVAPGPVAPRVRLGGRPTEAFAHRGGMITKPEVRSVVLGRLDLPDRGVLWDVGAGSGSVAIEAALAAPGLRVLAIERDRAAADAVLANAAGLGALVEVVAGSAPEALPGLPAPDRVFVGGGGIGVLDACLAAARPGARVVASYAAVDRAIEARQRLGALVQVSIDRAVDLPDGGVRLVADNPVFVAWGDIPTRPTAATELELVLGVGCSTDASAAEMEALIEEVGASGVVRASLDARIGHRAVGALAHGFSARLLGAVAVPNPSEAVRDAVGTPSVAEAAALLAAGPDARLTVTKTKGSNVTAAVARRARPAGVGTVRVVGLGPGGGDHRTPAAVKALRSADAVVGYGPYVDAASALLLPHQRVFRSAMGDEAGRAEDALALASAGWEVALVSSGDPGVFAMAATCLEVAVGRTVSVEVIPGVTAAHAAAAATGAPLAGPHALVTLSDLLQPWAAIEGHLRASAQAGMALALYNPRSAGRPDHLARALGVLGQVLAGTTPVAVVSDVCGPAESVAIATLDTVDPTVAGMRSIVLVGTAETELADGRLVTRRHHPR